MTTFCFIATRGGTKIEDVVNCKDVFEFLGIAKYMKWKIDYLSIINLNREFLTR